MGMELNTRVSSTYSVMDFLHHCTEMTPFKLFQNVLENFILCFDKFEVVTYFVVYYKLPK